MTKTTKLPPPAPLSDAVIEWLKSQPKPVVKNVVDEMNARFLSYKQFSFMTVRQIDAQVRQDFAAHGATSTDIIFDVTRANNNLNPYSRKA